MIKIMKDRWDTNKDRLQTILTENVEELKHCGYEYLVKTTFGAILCDLISTNAITMIDDGDYQGTLLFLIPFNTYQPSAYEYLMTHVYYGSCSGCDALQSAQMHDDNHFRLVNDIMDICRCLVCNTIKPYNHAWYHSDDFDPTDETIE